MFQRGFKYECGMCGELSTADEWNRETMDKLNIKSFEDNYGRIEEEKDGYGCYYFCPKCKKDVDGVEIYEVE